MRSIRHGFLSLGVAVLVMAAVSACGSSPSSPATPTPVTPGTAGGGGASADVTITISGFSFSPNPASIAAGQTVAWRNADSVTHTATADNGSFNTGAIAPGATSAPIQMSTAGSFAYTCAIHPTMVASLVVQ
jgi:plastocyanin